MCLRCCIVHTNGGERKHLCHAVFLWLWNSFSAPQLQLRVCGKERCCEQWDILKQEGDAVVMDTLIAGLHPAGALQWCLQGCPGVTHTERARLQAPPGHGASLNLSSQPLVIWLLMKGRNWKGLSSEGFARECHWHRTRPPRGRSQHVHGCVPPPGWGLAANLPLASPW